MVKVQQEFNLIISKPWNRQHVTGYWQCEVKMIKFGGHAELWIDETLEILLVNHNISVDNRSKRVFCPLEMRFFTRKIEIIKSLHTSNNQATKYIFKYLKFNQFFLWITARILSIIFIQTTWIKSKFLLCILFSKVL